MRDWHRLDRAEFEGLTRPAPTPARRFRDRHWPCFGLMVVRRERRTFPASHRSLKRVRAIERASRVAEVRGWLPCRALDAHYMRADDLRIARLYPMRELPRSERRGAPIVIRETWRRGPKR